MSSEEKIATVVCEASPLLFTRLSKAYERLCCLITCVMAVMAVTLILPSLHLYKLQYELGIFVP